jgi:hypothetical protein
MKKQNEKNKKINIIIVSLIVLLAVIIGILVFSNKPKENTSAGLSIDDFYSDEQCRCLERENLRCANSSWQLDLERKACIYEKSITNVVLGCSRYECNGITYVLNMDIKTWEVK